MTDKAKIRAEIEKRYRENKADGYSNVCEELWDILSFIDSMQEEPVRNPIDFEQELYKAFGQVKDFTLGMRIAKRFYDIGKKSREPVNEELEEAVNAYIGYAPEVDEDISTTMIRKAARHFAKWQKTKDESTTEDLGEYINELSKQFPEVSFAKLSRIAVRVTKWQKEQMMAKAVDGKVIANGMGNPILHLWDKGRHLIDKKVKVIIIKED